MHVKMCCTRLLICAQKICSNLQIILSHAYPAGTLPDAWQLPALQTLQVSGNGLTGTLPASWQSGMPNITVLRLKFNKLRCVLSWCEGACLLDYPSLHLHGGLPVGVCEAMAWLGGCWPSSRYGVLSLSVLWPVFYKLKHACMSLRS